MNRESLKESAQCVAVGLAIAALIWLLVGCRSQKHAVAEITESSETVTDSAGFTAWQGDMTQEAWRRWLCGEMRLSVSADSLVTPQGVIYGARIEMTAQDVEADAGETCRKYDEGQAVSHVQTVAAEQRAENSETESEVTAVYEPPSLTAIVAIASGVVIVVAGIAIVIWRKKRKR